MANIFKFRNLFCLIHKLYIALVKKTIQNKTKTKKKQWKQDTISKSGPFQLSKYKSSESCIFRLEQDKIMNGAMTFHKAKFYVTEGSFLGLINSLYKKREKNEIPVFQINLLHIYINPQCPGKQRAFTFCLILELESWFISAETPQATGKIVALK